MPHVFLSYSRKDIKFVEKLEHDLNARGIVTWRDTTSIPPGSADWHNHIADALDKAFGVVLVATPHSDESRWVGREACYADQIRLPVIVVLPVDYRPRRELRLFVVAAQPVRFDDPDYESGLARLVAAIHSQPKTTPGAISPPAPSGSGLGAAERKVYLDFLLADAQSDLRLGVHYVGLQATPEPAVASTPKRGLPKPRRPALGRLGIQYVDGVDCVPIDRTVEDARIPIREKQRVILLGEPGSGKTTTLLQLAVDLAEDAQADSAKPLPVFVPLRSFQGECPFADFVRRQMHNLQDMRLDAGQLVLLCDALNEMPRQANGRDLMAEVYDYLYHQPAWVVSCRVRDYQEELKDLPEVGRVRLRPLDLPRIQEVIQKRFYDTPERAKNLWRELRGSDSLLEAWRAFEHTGKTEAFWEYRWPDELDKQFGNDYSAKWRVQNAWQEIHTDLRRMMLLCRNPYMLSLVYEIFDKTGTLPDNRGKLFAAFVDDLLLREEDTSRQTGRSWLNSAIIRRALAQLAYAMQKSETGTEIPRAEAERILTGQPDVPDPALLLRLVASASLLDVGDHVHYTHQLLQEYFASEVIGAALDEKRSPTEFWPAGNWWERQGWEETAIILAGVRGDPEGVARWIAPAQPEVAYQALTESGLEVNLESIQPETRTALVASAQTKSGEKNPVARAATYRILGRFRVDNRPGVLASNGVPEFAWCEVPAGRFKMGGDPDAWNAWEGAEFDLPYSFWMAKYPVTVAQYEPFVAAGGYAEQRWWTEAGWKNKGSKAQPEYGWNDPQWHMANHPVIGVSWYEAYAYTQWVNEQGVKPTGAPNNYVIRLARECEWEKAARYPDRRWFPWGNEWDAAKLNSREGGIGRTSAVGMFPNGENPAHGTCDLSGNVWEWCLTAWAEKYQTPEAEKNDPQGDTVRCARGGSWFSVDVVARAAARGGGNPVDWYFYNGFRVVVSVPVFSSGPSDI